MSKWLPSVVQVCGIVCVAVGAFVWSPIAGWVVSGAGLIVTGLGLERGNA